MLQSLSLTRRRLLKASPAALLSAGYWPGMLRASEPGSNFSFIVANDLHSFDEKCLPWFEQTVKRMNGHSEKPEFLAMCGDLAEDGTAKQLDQIKRVFAQVKLPLFAMPGNHDYLKSGERTHYDDLFPKQLNQAFTMHGWQFLTLDTTEKTKYENTVISAETIKWVDGELPKLEKKKPLVIMTHFPLGEGVKMRPKNADELLKRFLEYNLRGVFSGHYHALTEKTVGDATLVTNRCCAFSRNNHDGTKEKGYFLVRVKDGELIRDFQQLN